MREISCTGSINQLYITLCVYLAVRSRDIQVISLASLNAFIAYLHHRGSKVPSHLSDILSLYLAAGFLTLPLALAVYCSAHKCSRPHRSALMPLVYSHIDLQDQAVLLSHASFSVICTREAAASERDRI